MTVYVIQLAINCRFLLPFHPHFLYLPFSFVRQKLLIKLSLTNVKLPCENCCFHIFLKMRKFYYKNMMETFNIPQLFPLTLTPQQ